MPAKVLFSALRLVSTEAATRSNDERFASCPERLKSKRPVEECIRGLDIAVDVEVWKSSILQVIKKSESLYLKAPY